MSTEVSKYTCYFWKPLPFARSRCPTPSAQRLMQAYISQISIAINNKQLRVIVSKVIVQGMLRKSMRQEDGSRKVKTTCRCKRDTLSAVYVCSLVLDVMDDFLWERGKRGTMGQEKGRAEMEDIFY